MQTTDMMMVFPIIIIITYYCYGYDYEQYTYVALLPCYYMAILYICIVVFCFFAMNIITIAATTATIVTTACLIDTND